MKRFGEGDFFGDEDQSNDYEDEYSEEENSMMNMGGVIPSEIIQQWKRSEINIEEQKINFIILQQSIQVLEKSWFWKYRSMAFKIRMISNTYHALNDLLLIEG